MRTLSPTLLVAAFVTVAASSAPAVFGAETEPRFTEHPGIVALSNEGSEWLYRKFPSSVRLYVHDGDSAGKSACNDGCAFAWPPLFREAGSATSVGDWAVFVRDDGREQWAYKGQPVYMRFHDSLQDPMGDKIDGWRFLAP